MEDAGIEELAEYHQEVQNAAQEQQFPDRLFDPFNAIIFRRYLKNNSDLVNFSKVSRQTYTQTAAEREIRETSALLLPVVQGNEDEAKRLLEFNPGLLRSANGVTTDYSKRHIQGLTPFQAALCAGDVEMCEMMKAQGFTELEDGEVELKKQFDEIFPDGLEAHVKTQQDSVFGFNDIVQAIIDAPDEQVTAALDKQFDNNLPLHLALDTFRKNFTEKSKSEVVFNPYHLLRAFAQGIYYIVNEKEPLRRSFQFRYGGGSELFPLSDSSGLGYDFAMRGARVASVPQVGAVIRRVFSELCRAKHRAWKNYSASAAGAGRKVCNFVKCH